MNWTDLKITVSTKDAETAEAIAQMAVPYGIYIEDYSDMLELVPQIAHIDLIDEDLLARSRTEAILHLYLPPEENPAEASAFLTHRLEAEGIPYRIETDQTLAEEDWANAWKRFYHPTHLGKRLVVCPSWEEYTPTPEELVMTLDPGMAFGSGTHHTTRLCCELLEQLPVEHTRILDMGTGSGILSIAALMLGAQEAVGVDIDKVAVRTAAENAEVNDFGPDRCCRRSYTPAVGRRIDPRRLRHRAGQYRRRCHYRAGPRHLPSPKVRWAPGGFRHYPPPERGSHRRVGI